MALSWSRSTIWRPISTFRENGIIAITIITRKPQNSFVSWSFSYFSFWLKSVIIITTTIKIISIILDGCNVQYFAGSSGCPRGSRSLLRTGTLANQTTSSKWPIANFKPIGSKRKFQAIASTMQKLESTGKQASNRFYKYQNALQKISLKIPKVCCDSNALILECGVYMAPQNMLW